MRNIKKMYEPKKSEIYQSILLKISQYEQDMYSWWASLQKESIAEWALLIGIACWGVPNKTAQLIAFIAALVLFFSKIVPIEHDSNFSKKEKEIVEDLSTKTLPDDQAQALSVEFERVKKIRRNTLKVADSSPKCNAKPPFLAPQTPPKVV